MEQSIFLKKEHQQVEKELYFDFCGFSKTMPFHSFGPAIRNDYILHVVMEGKGSYHVKNQQFQLKKGDLFLIRGCIAGFHLVGVLQKKSFGSRFSEKTNTRWSLLTYKNISTLF